MCMTSHCPIINSVLVIICFVDRCLSFCTFSFDYCVVCSSLIYRLWLPLWYLQTLLVPLNSLKYERCGSSRVSSHHRPKRNAIELVCAASSIKGNQVMLATVRFRTDDFNLTNRSQGSQHTANVSPHLVCLQQAIWGFGPINSAPGPTRLF
jgi:hypothetical protein